MIENINVRFFSYCMIEDDFGQDEPNIMEVSASQFQELEGKVTFEVHTVHENGVRQLCFTVEPSYYPQHYDLRGV